MKILYVLDSLGTGGAERSTADLWYFLREEKIEVSIVVLGHRKEGIQTEVITQDFNVYFLEGTSALQQSREIIAHINTIQPDIVHSVLFRSNLRTRLARMRIKFLHVESLVNCSYDRIRLKDPRISRVSFYFYKYLDRLTSGWVDHFHAITEVVRDHYNQEFHIPLNKISVVHRGRNENKFIGERLTIRKEYLREFNLPDNTVLIIHVGRQEYQKGHLVLLKAIERLSSDNQKLCVFLLLGREGNSTPNIKSFLSSSPTTAKLIWLGHRHDVEQLMAIADIFVFPSLYEGLGGALIEAQAASLPILCTDLPVLNEVVLKNQNALMHENEIQMAANLSRLIADDLLRTEMGKKGLANFRAKFLMDKASKGMLEFYRNKVR